MKSKPSLIRLVVVPLTILVALCFVDFIPAGGAPENLSLDPGSSLDDGDINPCDLMPSGGDISPRDNGVCVGQYSSEPGVNGVQIQSNFYNHSTDTLCGNIKNPSDFHVVMGDVDIGDCGVWSEISYQGEPAPGYTGWEVFYYYQGIMVRVYTKDDYPAHKNWIYNTAEDIEGKIDSLLGRSEDEGEVAEDQADTGPDTETESEAGDSQTSRGLPEWVTNDRIFMDYDWTEYYVPEWLDWIKPKQEIRQKGVVKPWRAGGEIYVYSRSFDKWIGPIRGTTALYSGDLIKTSEEASARVYFSDGYTSIGMSVGGDTFMEMPMRSDEEQSDYPELWTFYKGLVKIKRRVLGEIPARGYNPFIVRTMTIAGGTRGTDFLVIADPVSAGDSIYVLSGELNYYNLAAGGPEDGVIGAGDHLNVTLDGSEVLEKYDGNELDTLLAENGMDQDDMLEPEEILALVSEYHDLGLEEDPGMSTQQWVLIIGSLCCFGLLGLGVIVGLIVLLTRKKTEEE